MVAHQSVFLINELLIPVRESAEKPSALSPRSLLIVNSNPRFQRSESLYFTPAPIGIERAKAVFPSQVESAAPIPSES